MSQSKLQAEQKPEPKPTFYKTLEVCFFKPMEYFSIRADFFKDDKNKFKCYLYKILSLLTGIATIVPSLMLGITATLLVDVARVFFATPYFGALAAYLLFDNQQKGLALYLAPYYKFEKMIKTCHECAMENKLAAFKSQYFWEALIRITAVTFSILTFGLGFFLPTLFEAISATISTLGLSSFAAFITQMVFTGIVGFAVGEGITVFAEPLMPSGNSNVNSEQFDDVTSDERGEWFCSVPDVGTSNNW
jgi:hypothetical protein